MKENKKLLIVEDDSAFAQVLGRRMKSKDYDTYHAANVSDALMLARAHMPQFVLLDMKLEKESGLTIIKPLRALLPTAKIILLTGFASIATAVEAIKLGADDYLAKPVDTQTLLVTLSGTKEEISEQSFTNEQTMSPQRLEWEHIQQVLKANSGNISATARQLQMHRRTLQRKLQKKPRM